MVRQEAKVLLKNKPIFFVMLEVHDSKCRFIKKVLLAFESNFVVSK
jgi:hypothetical protein